MTEDTWKLAPSNPGFEINQKGQLRGMDISKGIWVPPVYREPAYKPFQGDEWPDHGESEIPDHFL